MTYPIVTGAILIEANGAALNNAGQDSGARTDNAIVVKQVRVGRLRYPYVSGQAWRRWWREVLYADFNWTPSEIIREKKSVYTKGDPLLYAEDDLFGYMAARKDKEVGTSRRFSPLKNSLLLSVLPNTIERDFGHFSRNLKPGEDMVPFESEHYTTYLQGAFTISLRDVGTFRSGMMQDLTASLVEKAAGELEQVGEVYQLSLETRVQRLRDCLLALARLRYGAHLARNLSDVSPVVALVGFLDGGNAPLQKLFIPTPEGERVTLHLERLRSVLLDYQDRLLSTTNKTAALHFGCRPGVLANEAEVREALEQDPLLKECISLVETPKQAIEATAEEAEAVFQAWIDGRGEEQDV